MIKASGGLKDGTPLLILGLSRENVNRLLAGRPIPVRVDDVDPRLPPLQIYLCAGETEEAIAAELSELNAAEGPE